MHFDFAGFLVAATFVTGAVWLADVVFFKRRRAAALPGRGDAAGQTTTATGQNAVKEPAIVEYSRSFFPVILLVLLLRSFLYEPFKIPSGSMMPTLLSGDFILVNKFAYGVRLPVLEWRILNLGRPRRGDAAVFRFPADPSLDYIKRVIGLPGDEISYVDKTLAINGEKIDKLPRGEYRGEDNDLLRPPIEVYREHIGRHEFDTLEQPAKPGLRGVTRVPAGHYFVMGDNRDNSNDSRYWGFVPEENLVGRADRVWMSWDADDFRVRWGRIGRAIP